MDIIRVALKEDIGKGDVTSRLIRDRKAAARIIAGEACVLSGIDAARQVFKAFDITTTFTVKKKEGSRVRKGETVALVKGNIRSLLACERTALNFLQHLSGIATNAREFVRLAGKATLLDTRKTTPGMRELEKKATRAGGVKNHRLGLYDMILIKDNHIKAEGLTTLLKKIKNKNAEVEVDSLTQLKQVLKYRVRRIMLDNFSMEDTRKAVRMVKGKAKLEYSGNVNKRNVARIARTGVDFISIGSELTLSARAVDFRMV